jgi:superfamily II DNA or RNA helicase
MNFQPRDYQTDAHTRIFEEWQTKKSTLVVIPTGGGKTILFALVIDSIQPKRALVIAHRIELITQARDKIQAVTGLDCGIEMAELYVNKSLFGETPVVVSTVQTMNSSFGDRKRMSRFNPKDFGVLVIDEAHRAPGDSYKDIINYFTQGNPDLRVLGVTATPDRADEESLGQIFESVAFDYEILDAIHDGWLVPIDQQFVYVAGLDFSHTRTTAGDLNGADLASVMEAEENMQGVAGASLEIIGSRRAIVFTASVKQAEMLSNIYNRHREGMADWVCGKTNKDDRASMLARFKAGDIQVVCNCGVLTEGFDDPGVEVIIMARPTKSRSLYAQMAGRSTRPLPGIVDGLEGPEQRREAIAGSTKPSCLIVDFVGNSGKHKLMSSADILGGNVSDEACARAVKLAQKRGGAVRMSDALDEAQDEVLKQADERRRAEEARKAKLVAKVQYTKQAISPFDIFQISPAKERGWDKSRTLTDKQQAVLLRAGINPDKLPYGQAKQLLNEQFRRWDKKLCTYKQAKLLQKHGYETKDMPMSSASKLIDALAKNGWKRTDAPFNGVSIPDFPTESETRDNVPF